MTDAPHRNAFGQPVGVAIPDWTPRPLPSRTPIAGRFCRLEPLAAGQADALHAAYGEARDDRDWTYLPHERPSDRETFRASVVERAASRDPLHMAVLCGGEALGSLALMRIDAANGVVEIGHVHFAPRLQRTAAATEAVFLLARRAFDELGYRRLEWKCDSLNEPSRRSALRLGFAYEGCFRHALVTKGRNRDTAWYAMTADDWPARRKALEAWLAEANFDDEGRQILCLAQIRAGDV